MSFRKLIPLLQYWFLVWYCLSMIKYQSEIVLNPTQIIIFQEKAFVSFIRQVRSNWCINPVFFYLFSVPFNHL